MSPECLCGSFVSESYARVFAPEGLDCEADVRTCPACARVRERGAIRQARSAGNYDAEGDVA